MNILALISPDFCFRHEVPASGFRYATRRLKDDRHLKMQWTRAFMKVLGHRLQQLVCPASVSSIPMRSDRCNAIVTGRMNASLK